jgi:ribosomal protein S4E
MDNENRALADGDHCVVVAGRHKGKSGIARDFNLSKSGHVTITVVQNSGVKFKTLARSAARAD